MRKVAVFFLLCAVSVDVDGLDFKRNAFRDSLKDRVKERWGITKNETDQAIIDRGHAPGPVERNVTSNVMIRPTSSPGLPSTFPSVMPSDLPSIIPSMRPSITPSQLPSATPSTSAPTQTGGVPVNLPPIPLFPTSTPPPTPSGGQPVTLPPIPLFPTGTQPPIAPTTGAPTTLAPVTNSPNQLPPIPIFPSGTEPPVEGPTVPPSPTVPPVDGPTVPPVPTTPPVDGPTAPPNDAPTDPPEPASTSPTGAGGITIEEFLTLSLTDDGTLQAEGTPQNQAFNQLILTNPDLDPNVPADQNEIMQRYSLNTLYFSSGGSNWAASGNWTTAQLPCGETPWFGLTCGGNPGPVAEINLRENLMVGTIPSEMWALSDLRT